MSWYHEKYEERRLFRDRLKLAMKQANCDFGPVRMAQEINARYPDQTVTKEDTRKWTLGHAIPPQSVILTLASWLGVSATWLRFGNERTTDNTSNPAVPTSAYCFEDLQMLSYLQHLDEKQRALVRETVRKKVRSLLTKKISAQSTNISLPELLNGLDSFNLRAGMQ